MEPLAAQFCNGTTSFCEGLSQWGSQTLAQDGFNSVEILRYYYGQDIELVPNAPLQDIQYSYPGQPMRQGDTGPYIRIAQIMLNRIAENYPAIPRIQPVNGVFTATMEKTVRIFQGIFNLTADGIIGRSTWYMMVQLYTSVLRLSELVSLGQTYYFVDFTYTAPTTYGQTGSQVSLLQYMLSMLSQFNVAIPFVTIDGIFGNETLQAVLALQRDVGLPETGVVDEATWLALVNRYRGINETVINNPNFFPDSPEGVAFSIDELESTLEAVRESGLLPIRYGQTDTERRVSL